MKTKIWIVVAAIICVLIATVAGVFLLRAPELNYDKLYKAYDPEEIVAECGDEDVTWDRYFNVFAGNAQQIEYYMAQMETYYGIKVEWDDVAGADGSTFVDQPRLYAEDLLRQSAALSRYAASVGTTYIADDENSVTDLFKHAFGENGEKVSDSDALEWMNEKGYMHVIHILFLTKNRDTGESEDEDTIIKKKALAQEKYEELTAIEDNEEQLKRFRELIDEYNEDPGMIYLPDGYTFLEGSMYTEFSDAAKKLGEYEVSEPTETVAGYHIIMRLPLDPDDILFENYANMDTTATGRRECAYEMFDKTSTKYYEETEFNYVNNFVVPDLKKYLH